jgi:hypothetical protein
VGVAWPIETADPHYCLNMCRSDITTAGDHVHIKLTMRYSGSQTNPVKIQELPAVFLSRRLSKLMFYDGPEPWKVRATSAC